MAPAGPSMIALQTDVAYRDAIAQADLAIADSGWMVLFWRILRGEKLTRISGLKFFKCLLELPEVREPAKSLLGFAERKGETENTRLGAERRLSPNER